MKLYSVCHSAHPAVIFAHGIVQEHVWVGVQNLAAMIVPGGVKMAVKVGVHIFVKMIVRSDVQQVVRMIVRQDAQQIVQTIVLQDVEGLVLTAAARIVKEPVLQIVEIFVQPGVQ